jgi:hypothetical protein
LVSAPFQVKKISNLQHKRSALTWLGQRKKPQGLHKQTSQVTWNIAVQQISGHLKTLLPYDKAVGGGLLSFRTSLGPAREKMAPI